MFKKAKIGAKIFGLVLTLIVFIVVAESVLSFNRIKKVIKEDYISELSFVTEVQEHKLEHFFVGIETDLKHIQKNKLVQQILPVIVENATINPDSAIGLNIYLKNEVFNTFEEIYQFEDIFLLDTEGRIIYDHSDLRNFAQDLHNFESDRLEGFYYGQIGKEGKEFFNYASLPIYNNDVMVGLVACKINVKTIVQDIIDTAGLGVSGEILFGKQLNKKTAYLNTPRRQQTELPKVVDANHPIFLASQGKDGADVYTDYSGKRTLAVWKHIPSLNIGLVAKINEDEAFKSLPSKYSMVLIKGFIVFIIAVFLTMIFTKSLTRPIEKLKAVLDRIRQGALPEKVSPSSSDEIGEMTTVVNNVIDSLRGSADFAQEIGNENFEGTAGFTPLSEEDRLGQALITMRQNLLTTHEQDETNAWINEGVSHIAEILRTNNTIQSVGDQLVKYVCTRLDSRHTSLYMTDEETKQKMLLELKAAFAFGKKKHIKRAYKFAETLVGQTAAERNTIFRLEIPEEYDYIKTGQKDDTAPVSALFVPLIANEHVHGVIEIAADRKLTQKEIIFIEQSAESIAQTLFNLKVNEQTRILLDDVRNAQNRIENLLENATELIVVYNEAGVLTFISPSVDAILGYEAKDLLNTSDLENIHEDQRDKFSQLLTQLKDFPDRDAELQYIYRKKDKTEVWLEAIGKNLLNDPAVKGLVFNVSDITERRRAEEEMRMRGQMQALSENSLDLITRISKNGDLFYVNPTIKTLTGGNPSDFMNKSVDEVKIDGSIRDMWKGMIDEVIHTGKKASTEFNFPSLDGEKIMTINAMPEYGEDKTIDSVLLVSHDITEQKRAELDIRDKNKKINSSINYAERIQEAILPDNNILQEALPESFIMYKPRDVVSGDFPWFTRKGDDIYISAVDCTGHGVPGAMISVVGYFLLNNIVKYNVADTPGTILDHLDQGVTETFKQNLESSKIKDGMDVAFCKINLKTKVVEYAGAHRPMYLVRNGELEEIKGDRFPIGGGSAYRNKTNFTNFVLNIQDGDTIYFFSDGLPDQFGGPKNRKFGPKKIKQFILDNAHLPMPEISQKLEDEYQEWKGDEKQFDDILLFGIRF